MPVAFANAEAAGSFDAKSYGGRGGYGSQEAPGFAARENGEDSSPFLMPADEEIFRVREEETQRKADERVRAYNANVADKTTFSSRMQATFSGETQNPFRALRPPRAPSAREQTLAAAAMPPERRKDKESMAEFISKKREIFLVQMSLDTKRSEIRKLEERALQRDEALKKSGAMLEEDALRFDAFLKENDDKVQEAIKKAEVEAKAKQDKVMEIKRLNTAIAGLRSELNKYEEQLEDCRKYEDFLASITPQEWFEQQAAKHAARREARLAEWQAACEKVRKVKADAQAAKARAEHEFANARTQQEAERAERAIKDATVHVRDVLKLKEPERPKLDVEEDIEDGMYFTEPAQLLKIYAELEESNLFLIQNAQETEEALEELKGKFRDTKTNMDAEVAALSNQIQTLEFQIESAQDKVKRLKERTIENVGALTLSSMVGNNEVSLDALSGAVAEVYGRCGFDADASIGTLQMLTNIESKLEEYLAIVDTMPPEFVEGAEKAREKERRQVAREEKLLTAQREHEARVRRALERAAAPVFKKTGKPQMFRSQPPRRKVVVQEDSRNDDEAELDAFLAKEML